jgi:hypothetical protein
MTGALALNLIGVGLAAAETAAIDLVPHRAIYDLKLLRSSGKRALEAVRGRIVYDFSGNACEGFALQFRQVTELDSGEGKSALSDLRTATWEDAKGESFRFKSQNYLNQQLADDVDGHAERQRGNVNVSLTKPSPKKLSFGDVVFPTQHMRKIIAAARDGKSLLELQVYDGSESGEKVYSSLAVIGRKIGPDEKKPTDAARDAPSLAGMPRWPVTISYFEKDDKGGEQTPGYAISFEVYENGISRALALDYSDFTVAGEMSSLEVRESKPCK